MTDPAEMAAPAAARRDAMDAVERAVWKLQMAQRARPLVSELMACIRVACEQLILVEERFARLEAENKALSRKLDACMAGGAHVRSSLARQSQAARALAEAARLAKSTLNTMALERRKLGPIATKALQDAHALAAALSEYDQAGGGGNSP